MRASAINGRRWAARFPLFPFSACHPPHFPFHQLKTMASPGAGIEAMWAYASKREEEVNGEMKFLWRCVFCDDKISGSTTRIEEHLTGLRLREGELMKVKNACTVVNSDLEEALCIKKQKLFNDKQQKRMATNNFLQRSSSENFKKYEAMPQGSLPAMMNNSKAAKEAVDASLCEMIYDNNLSPYIVDSVTF